MFLFADTSSTGKLSHTDFVNLLNVLHPYDKTRYVEGKALRARFCQAVHEFVFFRYNIYYHVDPLGCCGLHILRI